MEISIFLVVSIATLSTDIIACKQINVNYLSYYNSRAFLEDFFCTNSLIFSFHLFNSLSLLFFLLWLLHFQHFLPIPYPHLLIMSSKLGKLFLTLFGPMDRSRVCQIPSLKVWSKLSISTSGMSFEAIRT